MTVLTTGDVDRVVYNIVFLGELIAISGKQMSRSIVELTQEIDPVFRFCDF